MSTITIEQALKPVFNQWLEELLPSIKKELCAEILSDLELSGQQSLFNQQEMAKKQNVSVTTFKKWREMGLQAEPSPTGKLLFDINLVNQWRKENDCRKER